MARIRLRNWAGIKLYACSGQNREVNLLPGNRD
jgi:hypothetical protein